MPERRLSGANQRALAALRRASRHGYRRLGTALVQQLVERGLVHDFADLYALDVPTLAKLRRLADKSASNLVAAIDRSRERGFARLLFGLGIRHVGERVAAILAARYGTIDALAQALLMNCRRSMTSVR